MLYLFNRDVLLRKNGFFQARSLKSVLVLPSQIFGLFGPPKKRVNFDKFNQRHKCVIFCPPFAGLEKTSRISEFSGGRLFEKIEWGPPLKTEKLLWVMKKTEKARIEWGGSHSILATGARRNPELRGGSHSILSKRRPLRGGSQFPFYLVKKAALVGQLPFYPGKKTEPTNSGFRL